MSFASDAEGLNQQSFKSVNFGSWLHPNFRSSSDAYGGEENNLLSLHRRREFKST